ncbi:hypothetical protein [Dyella silvae]|uniref:hypothetical protein n=1 Tax=Dyella silvae TaxID=2994424 RepID=UPI002264B3A6|nr:hypothetical protein [Dyella silvae]
MSIRFRLIALSGLTLLASGCVVEQPAPRPRPVVVEREQVVQREYVEVIAPQPPPTVLVEEEPPHRPGYVWARGYWHWNGHQYVAVHGHWEGEREGYHYVHPHYEHRNDGWHLNVGVWVAG